MPNATESKVAQVWLTRSQVLDRLQCSRPQLGRDLAVLCQLELQGFDYIPHERWFSLGVLRILEKYRSLVRQRGSYKAVLEIVREYGISKESG